MTREFKVGDKVFDLRSGNGEVVSVTSQDAHAVSVKFAYSGVTKSFTRDGKWHIADLYPTLFHGHDLIIEVKEPEYEYVIAFLSDITDCWDTSSIYYKSVKDFTSRRPLAKNPTLIEPSKRLVKRG